jgi:TonB-dependent starch-binding outer membrane protein SusC
MKILKRLLPAIMLVLFGLSAFAQQLTVTGVVKGTNGLPLNGATVNVKGATTSAQTDETGKFSITASKGQTLIVTYVGYSSAEIKITDEKSVSISLEESSGGLVDVVVIGYQTIRKKDLTSAATVIDPKLITRTTSTTVAEAIQGLAPGVSVRSGGQPGQESVIEIRGIGNLRSNNPLYVIDGLISYGNRDFNVNDIESVQILKDAAAAAIYGADAANGVVIITTKKGKEGPMRLNFSAKYGMQQIPKRWDLMDATEFAAANKIAYQNAGLPPLPSVSTAFNPAINTDWQDAIMQNGSMQEYNVDLSGGIKNATYLISGNYFKNNGTIAGTSFDRFQFRVNTEGKRGIFTIGQNLSLTNAHNDLMEGNPFIDMVRMLPVIAVQADNLKNPLSNPDGYGYGSNDAYTFGTNPVAINKLNQRDQYNFRIRGNAYAEIKPLKWIGYKFNVGIESSFDHFKHFRKPGSWTFNQPVDPSFLYENRGQFLAKLFEHTVDFNKSFNKHSINGVAGYRQRIVTYQQTGGSKDNYLQNSNGSYYTVLNAGTTNAQVSGFDDKFVQLSMFGRVNYNYNDRYLLSATFARNADSRFGKNFRWGNFPGLSAAWRISNEKFFNVSWINDLKLRASYGELGLSNLGSFDNTALINTFPLYIFGNSQTLQTGATQSLLANADLRWEKRKTTNIGTDVSLLNNRITITAEYYKSVSEDVLINAPIALTTGSAGSPLVNAASLENTGIELGITYRENRRKLKYDITANITTVKNKVTELGNLGVGKTYIPTGITRTQIGRSVGEWFVWQTDGLFQNQKEIDDHKVQPWAKPGDIRLTDTDNNGVLNDEDRTFTGSPWPKLQTGFVFNASYKRFTFNMIWYGVFGNKIFNSVRYWTDRFEDNGNYRRGIKPWTPQTPNTDFPRVAINNGGADLGILYNSRFETDRWIENGSYLRLRNLEIGYTVAEKLLGKIGFTNARVYVSGQNLVTFSKYLGLDPDITGNGILERGHDVGNYPASRIISFGLQCGF